MTDYISREAAFKEFADFVRPSNNSDFADVPTWNDAVSLIGSLPAADVVEVRHGRWKGEWFDHKMMLVCSDCGCFADKMTDYCPNCGAKMDGGAD